MNETVIKSNAGKSFFFVLESFLIFLIGMSNIGNEIARGEKVFVSELCIYMIFLLANTFDLIGRELDGREWTVGYYIGTNIFCFLIVGAIILILYRKGLFCRKKGPKEVYLSSTYIQCDDARYELDNISEGTFTASQYLGKREIKFKYNDKLVVLRFGKHNKEQGEIFADYDNLVQYLLAKGFQREILHK